MSSLEGFDASTVAPVTGFELIPAGVYPAIIEETESTVTLFAPGSAAYKQVTGLLTGAGVSGQRLAWVLNGAYESTTAVDAFQIRASTGNLASGIVRLYGFAK